MTPAEQLAQAKDLLDRSRNGRAHARFRRRWLAESKGLQLSALMALKMVPFYPDPQLELGIVETMKSLFLAIFIAMLIGVNGCATHRTATVPGANQGTHKKNPESFYTGYICMEDEMMDEPITHEDLRDIIKASKAF